MTLDEAKAIGRIICTADGGCSTCVKALIERANAAFPEFEFSLSNREHREQPQWSDDPDDSTVYRLVDVRKRA